MRLSIRTIAAGIVTAAALASAPTAGAQGITDLLKGIGSKTGSTITNVIEGVFSRSDIGIADVAGTWKSTGPAVTFKSENFLKKAGGIAGAAAIETELKPYYEQYGLNGMTLSIDNNGEFTMTIKKLSLKGVMTPNKGEGTFEFEIRAFGSFSLGSITAYVTTTGQTMDIMFDATKMKQLISMVAKLTNMKMAQAVAKILDSYDGACIGFKMSRTGKAPATNSKGTTKQNDSTGSALDGLLNIFGH